MEQGTSNLNQRSIETRRLYEKTEPRSTPAMTAQSRHMTTTAVIFNESATQLLLVVHDATGKVMFPGGHIEAAEDPGQACVREVYEETGIWATIWVPAVVQLPGMVQLPAPWLVYEVPAPAKPDRGPGRPAQEPHTHIELIFIGRASSSVTPVPQLGEVSAAWWAQVATLDQLDVRAEVPAVAALAARQLHDG